MATSVFLLFALGVYGGITLVFKIVYQSRTRILATNTLSEQLEVVRNLPYDSVGTVSGTPSGLLSVYQIVNRNGVDFGITTTVRSMDDPFDGLAGGNPDDLAPDDYKLVEMEIMCISCTANKPMKLSTRVAPKRLEGGAQNGALYIHVFDADGQDMPDATVNIVNYSKNITLSGVTDSDGMVREFNLPTGTLSYNITVTKTGYSTDRTVSPTSTGNSDPTKLPASIQEQTITEMNFAIDLLSNLTLHSINSNCSALGSKDFKINGAKLIATDPSIYKFSKTFTTDSGGNYSLPNLEWGTYDVSTTESNYVIAGSIPMLPFDITPGLTQDASIILVSKSEKSLLVNVRDVATGLPLSGATVELSNGGGYNQSLISGLGYVNQTDWSDGSGQTSFSNKKKYFNDSGTVDVNSPEGDITLELHGHSYSNSGWLESSTFDLGSAVNFNNIIWEPLAQDSHVGANAITMRIATSNSSTPSSWVFTGPNGSTSTFYTATSTLIYSGNNEKRYLRYRVFLNTANTSYTPEFSDVSFTYTNSCSPPGQAFFNGLNSGTYTLNVSLSGYATASGDVDVSGTDSTDVQLSPL